MIQELIKDKGHLTIAALTVSEFVELLDSYKEDRQYGESNAVVERKEDHLVDLGELTEKLGVSRTTIYRMRLKGKLPEYAVNGKPKFNLNEVKRALKTREFNHLSSS